MFGFDDKEHYQHESTRERERADWLDAEVARLDLLLKLAVLVTRASQLDREIINGIRAKLSDPKCERCRNSLNHCICSR